MKDARVKCDAFNSSFRAEAALDAPNFQSNSFYQFADPDPTIATKPVAHYQIYENNTPYS